MIKLDDVLNPGQFPPASTAGRIENRDRRARAAQWRWLVAGWEKKPPRGLGPVEFVTTDGHRVVALVDADVSMWREYYFIDFYPFHDTDGFFFIVDGQRVASPWGDRTFPGAEEFAPYVLEVVQGAPLRHWEHKPVYCPHCGSRLVDGWWHCEGEPVDLPKYYQCDCIPAG